MKLKMVLVFFVLSFLCGASFAQETDEMPRDSARNVATLENGISELLPDETELTEQEPLLSDVGVAEVSDSIHEFPWVGVITGNRVNVRSGGNINFEILCQVYMGDLVIVKDKKVEWYEIQPPVETYFWIHSDFVQEGIVSSYSVNVRSGPGTRYSINCQVEKGDPVEVVEEVDQWYRIAPPPRSSAWVHTQFVEYKMQYNEYREKVDKEIAARIAEKERKRLLEEAEIFERKEFYKPLDEILFEEIIRKYEMIVNEYPGSVEAEKATEQLVLVKKKYADSDEYLNRADEAELQKKTTPAIAEKKKNQPLSVTKAGEHVVVEGRLEDLGVVIHRPGTYKLVKGRRKVCILKAEGISIDRFLYHKVRVKGIVIESDFDTPAVQVQEIELLR